MPVADPRVPRYSTLRRSRRFGWGRPALGSNAAQRESLSIDRTKALFDETLLPVRSRRPGSAPARAPPLLDTAVL